MSERQFHLILGFILQLFPAEDFCSIVHGHNMSVLLIDLRKRCRLDK